MLLAFHFLTDCYVRQYLRFAHFNLFVLGQFFLRGVGGNAIDGHVRHDVLGAIVPEKIFMPVHSRENAQP